MRVKGGALSPPLPLSTASPRPLPRPRRAGGRAPPSQLSRSEAWKEPLKGTPTWGPRTKLSSAKNSTYQTSR